MECGLESAVLFDRYSPSVLTCDNLSAVLDHLPLLVLIDLHRGSRAAHLRVVDRHGRRDAAPASLEAGPRLADRVLLLLLLDGLDRLASRLRRRLRSRQEAVPAAYALALECQELLRVTLEAGCGGSRRSARGQRRDEVRILPWPRSIGVAQLLDEELEVSYTDQKNIA